MSTNPIKQATKALQKIANKKQKQTKQQEPKRVVRHKKKKKKPANKKMKMYKNMKTHITAGQAAKMYIAHLSDPFNNPPVHTGSGGMPCHIWGSYSSLITASGSTTDCLVQGVPGYLGSATGSTAVYLCATQTTVYSAGTVLPVVWANNAQALLIVDNSRPISFAIRMSLRFPAATTPPILMAGRFPNNTAFDADITGLTGAGLYAVPNSTKGGSSCTSIQSNWVPQDYTEFGQFNAYNTAAASSTTNPYVAFTGKIGADACQVLIEVIQFFCIQSNSLAQQNYYINTPQPAYTPAELWDAYIRLKNTGYPAATIIENYTGTGHSHGEDHGLAATSDSSEASSNNATNVVLTANTVLNPISHGDTDGASGVLQVGGSTVLAKLGALAVAGVGHMVAGRAANNVVRTNYADIENQAHFAAPAAFLFEEKKNLPGACAPFIPDVDDTPEVITRKLESYRARLLARTAPSTSPTNQEMHALNGNGSSWSVPVPVAQEPECCTKVLTMLTLNVFAWCTEVKNSEEDSDFPHDPIVEWAQENCEHYVDDPGYDYWCEIIALRLAYYRRYGATAYVKHYFAFRPNAWIVIKAFAEKHNLPSYEEFMAGRKQYEMPCDVNLEDTVHKKFKHVPRGVLPSCQPPLVRQHGTYDESAHVSKLDRDEHDVFLKAPLDQRQL